VTAASVPDGNTIVGILILFAPGFAAAYPGAGTANRIHHLVDITNQAYADRGVRIVLRLVQMEQIDYTDTGDNSGALNELTDGSGPFEGVESLRQQFGADLVCLIRPICS